MTARRFRYRFISPDGREGADQVSAGDRAEALRLAARQRRTVTEIAEVAPSGAIGGGARRVSPVEAGLVLTQLHVMLRAGVGLLEALDIVAAGMAGRPIEPAIRETGARLRKGERLAKAMAAAMPFYPSYVFALVGAGEASGRLALVLDEAARQMAFDRSVARDIQSALVYPAFLVVSGFASVGFLFYVVVPRFAEMLRNARAPLEGFPGFIIQTGVAFHDNIVFVLAALLAAGALIWAGLRLPGGQAFARRALTATPGLGALILARQRTFWAKVMALALAAGVDILQGASLATSSLPEGQLKRRLAAAAPMLRSGRPVDAVFLETGAITQIDASLVRAGQRSGAMAEMFKAVAERNETDMRHTLKRITLVVEPVAIAIVAAFVGAIVLGLVSALASIYDAVG